MVRKEDDHFLLHYSCNNNIVIDGTISSAFLLSFHYLIHVGGALTYCGARGAQFFGLKKSRLLALLQLVLEEVTDTNVLQRDHTPFTSFFELSR